MTLEQYKTSLTTLTPLSSPFENIAHMLMGMQTELGELTDIHKKNLAYNKPIDEINEKEELGDLLWYIAGYAHYRNINLDECLQHNLNKLKQRYPNGFNVEHAVNRDINKELLTFTKEG